MNSKYERWFKFWVPIFTLKKDNWFLQKIKSEVCSLPLNRNINALFTHKMAFFFFHTKVIVNYIKLNILCLSQKLKRKSIEACWKVRRFYQFVSESLTVFNISCCIFIVEYFKQSVLKCFRMLTAFDCVYVSV